MNPLPFLALMDAAFNSVKRLDMHLQLASNGTFSSDSYISGNFPNLYTNN